MSDLSVVVNLLDIPLVDLKPIPPDISALRGAVDLMAKTTVREGKIHLLDISLDSYAKRRRQLHDNPAACAWARHAFQSIPAAYYFFTSPSQLRFVGWLCGPFTPSALDNPDFQRYYDKVRLEAIAKGRQHGVALLRQNGAEETLLQAIHKYHKANDPRSSLTV